MKASAQSTSHGGWAERNPAGAVTCGLLLSPSLSCWLAREEGGRREGLGERQSCLAGLQVYLHPASRRSGRGEAAFRAGWHTSTWLSVGLRFWVQTPCVWDGREAAVDSTEAAHLRLSLQLHASLGCLASLCLDNTCGQQWPPRDIHSFTGVPDNASGWAPGKGYGSGHGEQTGVMGAQIPIRLSKMTAGMTR